LENEMLHRRFRFRRDVPIALTSLPFGVTGHNAYVETSDDELIIRFGPWTLRTPMSNVAGAERTGPYSWWKIVGPARLSFADAGVTFATSTRGGVCITFHRPVSGGLPLDVVRHPGATVTVEDPDELVRVLNHG
jgi:hypothetical protein